MELIDKDYAMQPLTGVRVLAVEQYGAGPFGTMYLANQGAEVIKIEKPGTGDLARRLGADAALNEMGMGASFLAQNAAKRSLTLDLKSEEGRTAMLRLIATSDAVVENFRPGVNTRMALLFSCVGFVGLRRPRSGTAVPARRRSRSTASRCGDRYRRQRWIR